MGTPAIIARISSAIGQMLLYGGVGGCSLCARDGATDDTRAANQRCVVIFCKHTQRTLDDFLEEDLASLNETFAVTYLSQEALAKILQRAAHLNAGLCPESVAQLQSFGRLEAAVRSSFPGLVETLPDFTLGYCRQLAAACA